uniref:Coiled-coil domain-containing protein n=1 Tax=Strongyloides stercoralis TaxID=6248 RepID=A0A0K0E6S1_STRER
MAMRYGKIYYYDRMGNKIENEAPYLKEDVDLTTLHNSNDGIIKNSFRNDIDEGRYDVNFDSFPLSKASSNKDFIRELPEELDHLVTNEEKKNFDNDSIDEFDKNNINFNRMSLERDGEITFTPPKISNNMIDKFDKRLLYEDESLNFNDKNSTNFSINNDTECINILDDDLCSECAKHELYAKNNEENKKLKRDLENHIKTQNELLMNTKKDELFPMTVLPQFDRENDNDIMTKKYNDKLKYRKELEDEIERRRIITLNEMDEEKFQNNKRNTIDAMLYAEEERRKEKKDNNIKEYQNMIYQHQINKKNNPKKDVIEWWERRPPFIGKDGKSFTQLVDDGSHLRRQLEKQKLLQVAGENLEIYKANMAKEDELARKHQKEKYKEMRNDIAEQARLIRESDKKYLSKEINNSDNQKWKEKVFDNWAKEHEKNDRKYRILQDCRKGDFGLFGRHKNDLDDRITKKYHLFDTKELEEKISNDIQERGDDNEREIPHTIHRCKRCHRVLKNF